MSGLTTLFSTPALVKILSHFFLHPDRCFYQSELVKETKFALIQVQRALNQLEDVGLISKVREGNRAYYEACRTHPAYESLKQLFFKTIIFEEFLRKLLYSLKNKILFAFIYGSFARSEETKGSDLDLFIVGHLTIREIASELGPFLRENNIEINPVVYSLEECKNRWKTEDPFISQTLQSPKIWLIGSEDELRKMVKRGETSPTRIVARRDRQPSQGRKKRSKRRFHSSSFH